MRNIVLVGIMGAGKTTVGKALARKLKREFIDMDDYLVEKYNMSIPDMFKISEDYFRSKETECAKDMSLVSDKIISTGGGIIKKEENIKYLKENGIVIYIDRPIETIVGSVNTEGRPLLKNGADKLYALDQERRPLYEKACDIHLINDGNVDEIVHKILEAIK